MDLRRRLAGGCQTAIDLGVELAEATVHGLDHGLEAPVDVGVARRELGRSLVAQHAELAAQQVRQHDHEGREEGEDDEDQECDDHWANAR